MDNPFGTELTLANTNIEDARTKVVDALAVEGFGVLTEIDVRATLKKKLDVDFRPYVILGACNPPLAYKTLQADPMIGLMLPCNVVVRQEGGDVVVSIVDPMAMLDVTGNADLKAVACEAAGRLKRVRDALTT
ncbi:MAG: DUF302 domain-containing protein [Pseudomonadota bacterium]